MPPLTWLIFIEATTPSFLRTSVQAMPLSWLQTSVQATPSPLLQTSVQTTGNAFFLFTDKCTGHTSFVTDKCTGHASFLVTNECTGHRPHLLPCYRQVYRLWATPFSLLQTSVQATPPSLALTDLYKNAWCSLCFCAWFVVTVSWKAVTKHFLEYFFICCVFSPRSCSAFRRDISAETCVSHVGGAGFHCPSSAIHRETHREGSQASQWDRAI